MDGHKRVAIPPSTNIAQRLRGKVTMMGRRTRTGIVLGGLGSLLLTGGALARRWLPGFLNDLDDTPAVSVSTVPTTGSEAGDQNPYGVTIVPTDSGKLRRGHILVSNFNNAQNLQGTGSTIVQIDPHRPSSQTPQVFFNANAPVGLTTALVVLRQGMVVVGSAPLNRTANPPTVSDGALLFLDSNGHVVLTLTDSALLNGPWDMTVNEDDPDAPQLFVSNVLAGTIVRILVRVPHCASAPVTIESITRIGSGFGFRTDPAALVVGPTGLAFDRDRDQLFVADTAANRIARLDRASQVTFDQGAGSTVFQGSPLQGPLGLVLVPRLRHLVAVNGDAVPSDTPPNTAVELTTLGRLVATRQLDSGAPGALFGVTLTELRGKLSLVYVDDNDATVKVQQTR
jgi:hypothetical protein